MLVTTFAVLLAAALPQHSQGIRKVSRVAAVSHQTRVELIDYHGWSQAYRITNGIADVIVVPGIGRIMSYSLHGQPETDPIWNNPAEAGKFPGDPAVWTNFGGDKVWPGPQTDWPKHGQLKAQFPPDVAFDSGPSTIARIPNGVRLTNPLSSNFNLQVTRDIVLRPGGCEVDITDTFRRPASDPNGEARMPVSIWGVTQTRSDARVLLPLSRTSPKYVELMLSEPGVKSNWTFKNGMAVVTDSPFTATKIGSLNDRGWLAALYAGNVVFAQHFAYKPGGPYRDRGTNAEVFTNNKPAYIEMEVLSPDSIIAPGRTLTRKMTWSLARLPKTPETTADVLKAVSQMLSKGRPG